jgi:hypothetical protein
MLWVILGPAPRSFIVLVSFIFARRLGEQSDAISEFEYPLANLVVLPEEHLQRVFWT